MKANRFLEIVQIKYYIYRTLHIMLKLRVILFSTIALLLVGLDMNVRAADISRKVVSKSTEKDDSEKESKDKEPQEIITHLDFFGAFSLFNVQLHWRDLSSAVNNESEEAKSSIDPSVFSLREVKRLLSGGNDQLVSAFPIITKSGEVIPAHIFRAIDGKTHFIYAQNKQSRSTIAYIQNCSVIRECA